jgi:hypothetical protein
VNYSKFGKALKTIPGTKESDWAYRNRRKTHAFKRGFYGGERSEQTI